MIPRINHPAAGPDLPRIYDAASARALREAATVGPWTVDYDDDRGGPSPHSMIFGETGGLGPRMVAEVLGGMAVDRADAALVAAAPDLAASVEHHARYADKAEAELIEAHDRARDAEAERAAAEAALTAAWRAVTDDDLPRLPEGDHVTVDAVAVGQRVAAVVTERDALNNLVSCQRDTIDELNRELDALRAIIEGRTTPPTDAEIDAHFASGCEWIVREYTTAGIFSAFSVDDPARAKKEAARPSSERRWRRWWAIGANGMPCAWPVVAEEP